MTSGPGLPRLMMKMRSRGASNDMLADVAVPASAVAIIAAGSGLEGRGVSGAERFRGGLKAEKDGDEVATAETTPSSCSSSAFSGQRFARRSFLGLCFLRAMLGEICVHFYWNFSFNGPRDNTRLFMSRREPEKETGGTRRMGRDGWEEADGKRRVAAYLRSFYR